MILNNLNSLSKRKKPSNQYKMIQLINSILKLSIIIPIGVIMNTSISNITIL